MILGSGIGEVGKSKPLVAQTQISLHIQTGLVWGICPSTDHIFNDLVDILNNCN